MPAGLFDIGARGAAPPPVLENRLRRLTQARLGRRTPCGFALPYRRSNRVQPDALLLDAGHGQHAAHPIGSEVGVSQEPRRVHQDKLLGEVDDRARALHPAHHLEA